MGGLNQDRDRGGRRNGGEAPERPQKQYRASNERIFTDKGGKKRGKGSVGGRVLGTLKSRGGEKNTHLEAKKHSLFGEEGTCWVQQTRNPEKMKQKLPMEN